MNNFRYADDTSKGKKQRGTEETLDEGESGEWKAGLKLNNQKTKILASGPITSWQTEREKVVTCIWRKAKFTCRWWKEMQKRKMAVWGGLTNIAVKRRDRKAKGEKERYKHLNAEFQRLARRDKKAFLRE